MEYTIAALAGDGIGPEVMEACAHVITKTEQTYEHSFTMKQGLVGGAAIDAFGIPLPSQTLTLCENAQAILFGSVGGPKWENIPLEIRPEKGLLQLRKHFDLFANLRPAKIFSGLEHISPLKTEKFTRPFDVLIVRELTSGIYFGEKGEDQNAAWDTMKYSISEIERIANIAFSVAKKRKNHICSVDKSNVLKSSQLWRKTVNAMQQKNFSESVLEHMYVDAAAMQLLANPGRFDVILTGNLFGDILSDEAAQISGSLGMLPSASLNSEQFGMYEPAGGSAPDIAGKNIANPIAQILSFAMLLKYSFGLEKESSAIERAVQKALDAGYRTADIWQEGFSKMGTQEMGKKISEYIEAV